MAKPIDQIHAPVMLERCIEVLGESLAGKPAFMIDGTLGLGGHSEAFLERSHS